MYKLHLVATQVYTDVTDDVMLFTVSLYVVIVNINIEYA